MTRHNTRHTNRYGFLQGMTLLLAGGVFFPVAGTVRAADGPNNAVETHITDHIKDLETHQAALSTNLTTLQQEIATLTKLKLNYEEQLQQGKEDQAAYTQLHDSHRKDHMDLLNKLHTTEQTLTTKNLALERELHEATAIAEELLKTLETQELQLAQAQTDLHTHTATRSLSTILKNTKTAVSKEIVEQRNALKDLDEKNARLYFKQGQIGTTIAHAEKRLEILTDITKALKVRIGLSQLLISLGDKAAPKARDQTALKTRRLNLPQVPRKGPSPAPALQPPAPPLQALDLSQLKPLTNPQVLGHLHQRKAWDTTQKLQRLQQLKDAPTTVQTAEDVDGVQTRYEKALKEDLTWAEERRDEISLPNAPRKSVGTQTSDFRKARPPRGYGQSHEV